MKASIHKSIDNQSEKDRENRLDLGDPSSAWLVVRGKVDLFFSYRDEARRSRLFPLGRIDSGGVVLGMDLSLWKGQLGVIGIGVAGTEVQDLSKGNLEKEIDSSDLDRALDRWIEVLCQRKVPVPKVHVKVETTGPIKFSESSHLISRHELRWLRMVSGEVIPLGGTESKAADFFILLPTYGVKVRQAGEGEIFTTEMLRTQGHLTTALAQFHDWACHDMVESYRLDQQKELKRLEKREAFELQTLEEAMTGFAGVLAGNQVVGKEINYSPSDPLFSSFERVANAIGIEVDQEVRDKFVRDSDQLGAITRATNIRKRRVILTLDWWRSDNGPLLGRLEENHLPVALLPVSPQKYELVKPTGEVIPVDEQLANQIDAHATMLYRPLPEKSLTARDLINYAFRGTRRDLMAVLLMAAAGTGMGLVIPVATGIIYDQVIPKASSFELGFVLLALLTSMISGALFRITQGLALVRFETRVDCGLQAALWDRILSLPVPFFKEYTSGDLNSRAMGIEQMRNMVSGQVVLSLIASVFSVFYLSLLFYYSPKMALVALLLASFIAIPLGLTAIKVRLERSMATVEGQLKGLLLQLLLGIAKLRLSGAEEKAFAQWARPFAEFKKLGYKTGLLEILVQAWNEAFKIISLIAIFSSYLYFADESSTMTVGRFIAFSAAFTLFLRGVTTFSDVVVRMLSLVPIYERICPILEATPEATEALEQPGDLTGTIEVNHIGFSYSGSDKLVLDDVSFKISPGEFVAIVGPSGSGKSTLLRMLLGFENPQSGSVYYDGMDLAGLDIRAVRRQIGVVLQNSQLVPGSIFDNIVGSLPLTQDHAWEAAKMVSLADDIKEMPMGMHTVISEAGGTLSGGQTQRLLIARALVNKPRVLFFDEATSALDNKTQAVVTASLNQLSVTRLVIAHRLSTIMGADKILVIEAGRLVESGTYDELMTHEGVFYRLANRQLV